MSGADLKKMNGLIIRRAQIYFCSYFLTFLRCLARKIKTIVLNIKEVIVKFYHLWLNMNLRWKGGTCVIRMEVALKLWKKTHIFKHILVSLWFFWAPFQWIASYFTIYANQNSCWWEKKNIENSDSSIINKS